MMEKNRSDRNPSEMERMGQQKKDCSQNNEAAYDCEQDDCFLFHDGAFLPSIEKAHRMLIRWTM